MTRTLIADSVNCTGQEISISGWVNIVRDHGKITFIDVYDRSGTIQVIGVGEEFHSIRPQFVVRITGVVNERPAHMVNDKLPTGGVEIKAKSIEVLAKSEELPFDMSAKELDLQLPTLLDHRSLTLRHPKVQAIFKVQAKLMEGFRKAAQKLDCTEIFVPTIAASSTEGGAEVFKVD